MDTKEKIERLEAEVQELEAKKLEKDEFSKLIGKRNRLKFAKLYAAGGLLKRMGKGLAEFAEKKEEKLDQSSDTPDKEEKDDEDPPTDVYEALFGEDNLNKQFGGL